MPIAQEIQQAIGTDREEAELLQLLRMHEWTTDLYLFSLECLGNGPQTDAKLAGNLEPRVAAYTRWLGDRILDWLAARAAGKLRSRRKIMILVPRECYKTTNITTSVPVWLQLHDPNISVVIDMAKLRNMADKTLAVVKEHMLGSRPTAKLIETFGDFYDKRRTWNDSMVVSAKRTDMARKDKTIEITSVDVGATGSHPDVWIWDDPVTRELAYDTWYNTCFEHYLGTFPIIRTDGLFILVATRYGEADPAGRIIEEEIAPAAVKKYGELPEDFKRNWHKYAHLAGWDVWLDHGRDPNNPEDLYYPSIWTSERIAEYENISPAEFAAQVMNMPGERKDMPLQREHVDRLWVEFADVPDDVWNQIYIHMDLAWKDAKQFKAGSGDYSVIQVWGVDNAGRRYYLPFAYRGRDMQDGFRRYFVECIQQLNRRKARIRLMTYDKPKSGMGDAVSNFFRDVFIQENLGPCPPLHEFPRPGQDQKDERCMLAARYWIDGTVRLVKHAPYVNFLVDEMLGIGVTKYDDMRDAAADQFQPEIFRPSRRRSPDGFVPGRGNSRDWGNGYFDIPVGVQNSGFVANGSRTPLELELADHAGRQMWRR